MKFPTAEDRNRLTTNYHRWMEWRLPRHERYYDEILNCVRYLKPSCTVQLLLGSWRDWLNGAARPASSESMLRRVSETCME